MALFINTNVASLGAQRSLATSGAELKTAMERLSSGKRSTALQMMRLALRLPKE